jgi:oxygen-independent coproporphyrinogen-3 oxidase
MIRHPYVHTRFCAKVCPYCAFHVHLGGVAAQREFSSLPSFTWERFLHPAKFHFTLISAD